MKLPRRRFLHLAAGAAALPVASSIAWAQTYPTRPVRIVVGYAPGGAADVVARLIGQWLSERFRQQFVIENRPGAGSNLATELVIRSPADGHTLLFVTTPNAANATLYEKLNFDFIRDIAAVGGANRAPLVAVVNPSIPVKTIPEFISYARANPGKINMASAGIGSPQHLSGELFKMMTGLNMTHVPYRGAAPALTDLIGGQVQFMIDVMASSIEHIRTGKLRGLAVTTSTRSEALPDLPTVGDSVPGYETSGWTGFGAPRDTPVGIIDQLNKAINSCLADPNIKQRFSQLGIVPMPMVPAEFSELVAKETARLREVIRFAGAKAE